MNTKQAGVTAVCIGAVAFLVGGWKLALAAFVIYGCTPTITR